MCVFACACCVHVCVHACVCPYVHVLVPVHIVRYNIMESVQYGHVKRANFTDY